MTRTLDERRRTHLHGLVAGSLVVLALFVAVAVPSAMAMLLAGQAVAWSIGTIIVFTMLVTGAVREARAWQASEVPHAI